MHISPVLKAAKASAIATLLLAAGIAASVAIGIATTGCEPPLAQPAYYEFMVLTGSPYERGFQHGERFASKIQSFYTMLLENSIFPYLNREHEDVASVLIRYQDEDLYGDGTFAEKMMVESAWKLAEYLPPETLEEIQGIADGSGMSFQDVLVMNTFFDTMMGFRSITFFIKLIQGPSLIGVVIDGGLNSDGFDNDEDGEIDEPDEGTQDPYEPGQYAMMAEVPTDAKIKFIIDDDKDGVNPDSVRIQLNDVLYTAEHPSIVSRPYAREGKTIEVTFTPPGGLPEASTVSLLLQCYDSNDYTLEKPVHPRSMRDERITINTVGYEKPMHLTPNRGLPDGKSQPPALGFAVRGSATPDDGVYLAHHFAMLDSNITHKHTAMFIHRPDVGPAFAVVGYTGVTWGLSGMNSEGLSFAYATSDTLSNSFAEAFTEGLIFAKMEPRGIPMGVMGRQILEGYDSVDGALEYFKANSATFGWNVILADAKGSIQAVELDGDLMKKPSGGFYTYSPDTDNPENVDELGRSYGSVGPDDIRISSQYRKNLSELHFNLVNFFIREQRYWSSFYLRSVKAFWVLGERIDQYYGDLDAAGCIELLRHAELADERDSMVAAVYEPKTLKFHIAAGWVPATEAEFIEYDLSDYAGGAK
jgi:Acyl-coenzyme A:6-aminopenicillanic acid acyl-transferase